MRWTDEQRDNYLARFLGFAHWPAPWHETEPYRADKGLGDFIERDTSNWETPWIDLGGEG
jgi:hypothetical protein